MYHLDPPIILPTEKAHAISLEEELHCRVATAPSLICDCLGEPCYRPALSGEAVCGLSNAKHITIRGQLKTNKSENRSLEMENEIKRR